MPNLPDVTINVQDGRLGISPAGQDGIHAKLGISSKGTANTLYTINSVQDVQDKLGVGPLAEACAKSVRRGIKPVYAMPLTIATPGAAGTVTKTGTGTSVLTVAGAALDAYSVIVKITRDGASLAANTAAFQISLDGGDTYSPEIAVPVSGVYSGLAADTGLTLTFAAGTFVTGTQYTFTSTAPQADTTGLGNALDALVAAPGLPIEGFHVVAPLTGAQATVMATKRANAWAAYKFWWALGETRLPTGAETISTWITAVLADYVSTSDKFSAVVAGSAETLSELTSRFDSRNPGTEVITHTLGGAVSQSPGETARGNVQGIIKLVHDEGVNPGLSDKFITMRTWDQGLVGAFVTDGRTLAPNTSDFQYFENVRTIAKVARAARAVALKYVNSRFRVNPVDGTLDPRDSERVKQDFNAPLDQMVNEIELSGYTIEIDPTQNVLSTQQILVDVSCIPVGIARKIKVTIGFTNPRFNVTNTAQLAPAPAA